MRTKTLIALMLTAVLALALAGCGGNNNDNNAGSSTTKSAATNETGSTASGTAGKSAGKTTALELAADPNGDLKFNKSKLSAKPGAITINFDNPSSVPHDVAVREGNKELGKSDVITSDSTKLELASVKAGNYTFFCSVPGHEQAGMKGTLTVK
jgi:plastocyanin